MTTRPTRGRLFAGLGGMITLLLAALVAMPASAAPAEAFGQQEVDQSLLVPATLDSSFAPFDCRATPSGVVCTGERHIDNDWAPTDLPCEAPLYGRYVEDRYQTRYYDQDYLNYYRTFRTSHADYLSTAPDGPATATIRTDAHFTETFAVPGDDTTMTITTKGVIWDVRGTGAPALFRVVGTLVEPYDVPATFTGMVTIDGSTSRYVDAPFEVFFDEDAFFESICQAATT